MTINELKHLVEVIYPISDYAESAVIEIEDEYLVEVREELYINDQYSIKDTSFILLNDGRIMVAVDDEDGNTIHKVFMTEEQLRNFCGMIVILKDGIRDF